VSSPATSKEYFALNVYRVQLPSGRILQAFQPHYFILDPGTPVRIWAVMAVFFEGMAKNHSPIIRWGVR
jgi:hypothetical protein